MVSGAFRILENNSICLERITKTVDLCKHQVLFFDKKFVIMQICYMKRFHSNHALKITGLLKLMIMLVSLCKEINQPIRNREENEQFLLYKKGFHLDKRNHDFQIF